MTSVSRVWRDHTACSKASITMSVVIDVETRQPITIRA